MKLLLSFLFFSCLSDAYFLCVTQINGNLEMSFLGVCYLEYRLL